MFTRSCCIPGGDGDESSCELEQLIYLLCAGGLNQGQFCPPRDIFDGHNLVPLASGGNRPGLQLNILPCTGQPTMTKKYLTHTSFLIDEMEGLGEEVDMCVPRLVSSIFKLPIYLTQTTVTHFTSRES